MGIATIKNESERLEILTARMQMMEEQEKLETAKREPAAREEEKLVAAVAHPLTWMCGYSNTKSISPSSYPPSHPQPLLPFPTPMPVTEIMQCPVVLLS